MRVRWSSGDGENGRGLPARGLRTPHPVGYASLSPLEPLSDAVGTHSVRRQLLVVAIAVAVAATIAVVPMLLLGAVSGHDFPFHLASWMDVARQWHHGTIYPQWAELANWGLGEPRFVFYPPASWMLGAALGSLFPWKIVSTVFVWLVLIAAGISMFLLARESLAPRQAVLVAAVIAVYSLVFIFLVAYLVQRDLRLLVYGAAATAGGFGLAAFYILPAARQRAWVQINQVLTDGLRPEQNFLFTRASSLKVNTDFNLKISCVVVLMAVVAAVAAYYLAKSSAIPRLQYALLVALGAMSFFMMWPLSRPFWALAPELHFVQFPWRYTVPFAVAFSFLVGAAVAKSKKLAIAAVCFFVFAGPLAKILLAVKRPSSWNKAEISRLQQNIDNGIGYRGTPEYLPNGSDGTTLSEIIASEAGITENELSISSQSHDQSTFQVDSSKPQQVTVKRFDFPTWQVNLDGARLGSKLRDSEGRIVVSVPPGKHVIQIFMQRDWDAKLGGAISIASATSLLGLTFLARRRDQRPTLRQAEVGSRPAAAALPNTALPIGNQPSARLKL